MQTTDFRRESDNMNTNLAYEAMLFATSAHRGQVRRYTGNDYIEHCGEVAGIVATVLNQPSAIAVSWLHDTVEDCGVKIAEIETLFGSQVADGVFMLSDIEEGSRAVRKAISNRRVGSAESWIQTIKIADIISNTKSIVKQNPTFAVTYLAEKQNMLAALKLADARLVRIAMEAIHV